MVALPAAIPFSVPVEPTVATDVLLLLQLPPVVVLLSVVFVPSHIDNVPVISAGTALMVTTAVL